MIHHCAKFTKWRFLGKSFRLLTNSSLVAQTVKNPPPLWETWDQSLGWENPLEEGMATHASILAWRIPWTRSLAYCSPWGQKESNMTEGLSTHTHSLSQIFSDQKKSTLFKRGQRYSCPKFSSDFTNYFTSV